MQASSKTHTDQESAKSSWYSRRWHIFMIAWVLVVLAQAITLALIGQINRHPIGFGGALLNFSFAWSIWLAVAYALDKKLTNTNISRYQVAAAAFPVVVLVIVWSSLVDTLTLPGSPDILSQLRYTAVHQSIWIAILYGGTALLFYKTAPDESVPSAPPPLDSIQVKSGKSTLFIEVNSIVCVTSQDYYVEIATSTDTHLVRESLYKLAQQLEPHGFVRVNRSVIVRRSDIAELSGSKTGGATVRMKDGSTYKVGKSFYPGIAEN